jgi:hypothetical protein
MLAVRTRTKRSSTQRRHRSSSSCSAAEPPPLRPANLRRGRAAGVHEGGGARPVVSPSQQSSYAGRRLAPRPLRRAYTRAPRARPSRAHQPRLPPPPARPAASSSAASSDMMALESTATRPASPFDSSLTTGTLRYVLHLSSALVSGLTSTVSYGSWGGQARVWQAGKGCRGGAGPLRQPTARTPFPSAAASPLAPTPATPPPPPISSCLVIVQHRLDLAAEGAHLILVQHDALGQAARGRGARVRVGRRRGGLRGPGGGGGRGRAGSAAAGGRARAWRPAAPARGRVPSPRAARAAPRTPRDPRAPLRLRAPAATASPRAPRRPRTTGPPLP